MHRRLEQLWEFGRQTGELADSDASVVVRTSLQNVPSCDSMKADTVRQGSHLHKDTHQFTKTVSVTSNVGETLIIFKTTSEVGVNAR